MRDKTTAAILALLFGWIGVHKYYLGKGVWGLFYSLFCWTGVPLIAGIIEFFILLSISSLEFDREYNDIRHLLKLFSENKEESQNPFCK